MLEQPAASWMCKMTCAQEAFARLGSRPGGRQAGGCQPGVQRVCTWMGAFGHELPKCSHLVGTLPTLPMMKRRRPCRRGGSATRPALWLRTSSGVQGGRELPGTAAYTPGFCLTLSQTWASARSLAVPLSRVVSPAVSGVPGAISP